MKKLMMALMLCLVSISAIAQVSIEKQENRYEFPIKNYHSFMHDLKDNTFCIVVRSDNEFETKSAVIMLGNMDDALVSVNAMLGMMKDPGDYKVDKYQCHAYEHYIYIYNNGDLEYAAGSYIITDTNLKKCLKWLEAKSKAQ